MERKHYGKTTKVSNALFRHAKDRSASRQDCNMQTHHSKGPTHVAVNISALEDGNLETPDCNREHNLGHVYRHLVEGNLVVVELDHLVPFLLLASLCIQGRARLWPVWQVSQEAPLSCSWSKTRADWSERQRDRDREPSGKARCWCSP